jgi:hypothetical protein
VAAGFAQHFRPGASGGAQLLSCALQPSAQSQYPAPATAHPPPLAGVLLAYFPPGSETASSEDTMAKAGVPPIIAAVEAMVGGASPFAASLSPH